MSSAVTSAKVEDLRTIEDRIITRAEPHLKEGGVLARMYAGRSPNQEVYDLVSVVKDVARDDPRRAADEGRSRLCGRGCSPRRDVTPRR